MRTQAYADLIRKQYDAFHAKVNAWMRSPLPAGLTDSSECQFVATYIVFHTCYVGNATALSLKPCTCKDSMAKRICRVIRDVTHSIWAFRMDIAAVETSVDTIPELDSQQVREMDDLTRPSLEASKVLCQEMESMMAEFSASSAKSPTGA